MSNESMGMYIADPDGETKGGVVVIQEAFGLTDHIQSICDRLATEGWLAVAPALFHRSGSPVFEYDDLEGAMQLVNDLNAADLNEDIDRARHWLEATGLIPQHQAILGFCMGGSVAWAQALRSPWGAAITYYGGGLTDGRFGYPPFIDNAADLATPWIGFFGAEDHSIPTDQIDQLAVALKPSGVDAEVHTYPDAGHAFNCDVRSEAFHKPSADDSWARTLAWLEKHVQ